MNLTNYQHLASFKNVSTTHCPEDLAKYLKIPEDGTKRRDIRVMLIFLNILLLLLLLLLLFKIYVCRICNKMKICN